MTTTELDTDFAVEDVRAGNYAQQAYLEYALSVVKSRALPDNADGQKPVQRRILYQMGEKGLTATSGHVKSAKVVGDVMALLHPHGDSAIYETMVRMAQNWMLRYPLVDGQGNFGSRDGDGAAAMRYTESRLTRHAELLLSELHEGTVDFQPNYDGSDVEPKLLPARLPIGLANGASGIAVGMATEIPSHNLRELAEAAVYLFEHQGQAVTALDLMRFIPGPDFAAGAQITSPPFEIESAYRTGRGSLKVRARWAIEHLARGQWRVIVNELPPGTSTQKILLEIEEATNPKIKTGHKALTPAQLQTKALVLSVLESTRDESDKSSPIRLVLEPKSSKTAVDDFIAVLLTHTSLQTSVPVNLTAIDIVGKPRQMDLVSMLRQWCDFRVDTVRRRSEHRLKKLDERIHILEGRRTAFLSLKLVIDTIQNSDDPKAALIEKLGLSEVQADDILDIRLRQLARLEGFKLDAELAEKGVAREFLLGLLGSREAMQAQVVKEIKEDAAKYGDDRRTVLEEAQKVVLETTVVDEPITVAVSKLGWVKTKAGRGIAADQFTFKDGDGLLWSAECRSVDQMVVLLDNGKSCSVAVSALPSARGDGKPLTAFIESGDAKIAHALVGAKGSRFVIAKSSGYGFVCQFDDMLTNKKAGKTFLTIEPGAHILTPLRVGEQAKLVGLSSDGRVLVMPLSELKDGSGGKGVQIMALPEVTLAGLRLSDSDTVAFVGRTKGGAQKTESSGPGHLGSRARRGAVILSGCQGVEFA